MSQAAMLRALDADMVAAFADAGMADAATYQAPDSASATPCTVLIDQPDMTRIGNDGPLTGMRTEITLYLSEISAPRRGGRVVVDGAAWKLDEQQFEDASQSRWVAIRDRP